MRLIDELNLNKECDDWFGRVTKSGRNGISISNSKDSRTYFIQEIKNKFEALLEN